jgi:hypothetical protein
MNLEILSTDIASRCPALAQDCADNRATVIKGLIADFIKQSPIHCAYCGRETPRQDAEGITAHIMTCEKNPLVTTLTATNEALTMLDAVVAVYESVRGGMDKREPVTLYLQRLQNADKLTQIVVSLNALLSAKELLGNLTQK